MAWQAALTQVRLSRLGLNLDSLCAFGLFFASFSLLGVYGAFCLGYLFVCDFCLFPLLFYCSLFYIFSFSSLKPVSPSSFTLSLLSLDSFKHIILLICPYVLKRHCWKNDDIEICLLAIHVFSAYFMSSWYLSISSFDSILYLYLNSLLDLDSFGQLLVQFEPSLKLWLALFSWHIQ